MCGREGGPVAGCRTCNGNERFRVPASGATLSDYRSGRVPEPKRDVNPKTHDPTWQGHDKNG